MACTRASFTFQHTSTATIRPVSRQQNHTCFASQPEVERQLFGEDFGARDPTAGEIESNFSEKNLWNWDTNHLIKAPDSIGSLLGLASKACKDVPAEPVDEKERELLRNQVAGWRVEGVSGREQVRREWTAQGPEQADGIKQRLQAVCDAESHPATIICVGSQLVVTLPADETDSLTPRDFVLAAKMNNIDVSDLEQKKRARYWA